MSEALQFEQTQDWVTPHETRWMKYLGHLAGKSNALGMEIGTWEGRSAHWFCENILIGEGAQFLSFDRDFSRVEKNREILKSIHGESLYFIEEKLLFIFCQEILPGTKGFDFCYIDGSKNAAAVLAHSCLVWRVLARGGILIWDDYGWPVDIEPREGDRPEHFSNPPRLAIDAFLQTHATQLEVLEIGWQVVVRKK